VHLATACLVLPCLAAAGLFVAHGPTGVRQYNEQRRQHQLDKVHFFLVLVFLAIEWGKSSCRGLVVGVLLMGDTACQ